MTSQLIGQITGTDATEGFDCIFAQIIIQGTSVNVNYSIEFSTLTVEQMQTVNDFQALLVSLAPPAV